MNTQISSSSTDASPQVALPAFSPTGVIHSGLITVEVVEPGDTESPHVSTQIRSVEMRWVALHELREESKATLIGEFPGHFK